MSKLSFNLLQFKFHYVDVKMMLDVRFLNLKYACILLLLILCRFILSWLLIIWNEFDSLFRQCFEKILNEVFVKKGELFLDKSHIARIWINLSVRMCHCYSSSSATKFLYLIQWWNVFCCFLSWLKCLLVNKIHINLLFI